jgi:hypothetical protein
LPVRAQGGYKFIGHCLSVAKLRPNCDKVAIYQ